MKTVILVGTFDTKGEEYLYIKKKLENLGMKVITIHAGVYDAAFPADISNEDVAMLGGKTIAYLQEKKNRGEAMAAMSQGLCQLIPRLYEEGVFHGILSIGGSGGTALVTPAMRLLPLGVPKIMVSTMASGDVGRYMGTSDILMMTSIVDVAGLNRISTQVFTHAVHAMAGLLEHENTDVNFQKPLIAATMYGVTTPCIMKAKEYLEGQGYEVLVFHASGTGGRIMESLIKNGMIAGVLDLTTTEWIDEICGGIMAGGQERLDAAALGGIPQVVSVGGVDLITFGRRETLPKQFEGRKVYMHNPEITVVRSDVEENIKFGLTMAEKLNQCKSKAILMLPLRGISMNDVEGGEYYGPDEDYALFYTLKESIKNPLVEIMEMDAHINDESFAISAAKNLLELMKER